MSLVLVKHIDTLVTLGTVQNSLLAEYNKMRKFVFDHPIISLCLVVNSGMRKLVADQQKQVFWLSLLPGGTKGRQVDEMT